MSWETSGSAGGLAKFDNFGKGPSRCVERQADSPHPDPLPRGGNSWRQVRLFGRFVGQTPRWVVLKASGGFSLSLRERAGVRGKVTLAVRTALALPQKSADRPKGRMALSHSFFHVSGFAGCSLTSIRLPFAAVAWFCSANFEILNTSARWGQFRPPRR